MSIVISTARLRWHSCKTRTSETLSLLTGAVGGEMNRRTRLMLSVGRDRVCGIVQNCFGEDRIDHDARNGQGTNEGRCGYQGALLRPIRLNTPELAGKYFHQLLKSGRCRLPCFRTSTS